MHEDSSGWQNYARRQADRLEAAMLADQTLEEQRDALVASFYEDHPEPVDIEAEFRSLVAAFEADHGDELAQHKARYVVGSLTAAAASEMAQRSRGAVLVSTWRTPKLPDDPAALRDALDERYRARFGALVAAAGEQSAVTASQPLATPRRPTDRRPAGSASQTSLVASAGAAAGYRSPNHPLARARRKDRLQTLLARGGPSGNGSSSASRASTAQSLTAAAAFADTPDGTVLTWTGIGREARRSRLAALLREPAGAS